MHEHLDEMGIIHMNGRIYDPYTGRFMSADPFIQAPGNLQSYNRYAYVMNNPLNLTDPSGYFSLKKLFRAAVSIAVAYYTGLQFGGLETLQGAVAGGFAGGVVSTGTLKGGLQGAFSAALFYGAGLTGTGTTQIEKANSLERYLAHAGAGCVSAVAGGGKCGQGMTAAVFGKFTTNQIEGWGGANKNSAEWLIAKGVATSIAGGAGSAIAGGKFDNGAATAAMGYLFNQVATILRLAGTYGPPLVAAAATQLDNLKEGARALSVMLSEGADKSAGDTPAPDREQTPTTNPENFDRIKGTKAKIDKETGEVWEHDQLHKDHWEVYEGLGKRPT
jgi:RHS repeat-associated protein